MQICGIDFCIFAFELGDKEYLKSEANSDNQYRLREKSFFLCIGFTFLLAKFLICYMRRDVKPPYRQPRVFA